MAIYDVNSNLKKILLVKHQTILIGDDRIWNIKKRAVHFMYLSSCYSFRTLRKNWIQGLRNFIK